MKKFFYFLTTLVFLFSSAFANDYLENSFQDFFIAHSIFNGDISEVKIKDAFGSPYLCYFLKSPDVVYKNNCISNSNIYATRFVLNGSTIDVINDINVKTGYYKISNGAVTAYDGLGVKQGSWYIHY